MPELNVSKKNLKTLFSELQGKKFIIPDYQRPYKWNIEKCETLWKDIEDFMDNEAKTNADYFLGTIVTFINKEKNQEIIDGQQRITSFLLLLRAFYRKLEDMPEDDDVRGLKNQISPCIWDINSISQKVENKKNIRIKSLVATAKDNHIFHSILEVGIANQLANDNYSKNYNFFKKCCDEYAQNYPLKWKELCVTILNKCIMLPIECDTPETALTIFSTLNDRGMPLSDSDIFKAQIYRNIETDELRTQFTTEWKELLEICKKGGFTIDDVFRYYSHILRAKKSDKSKEVGLRRFFAEDKYAKLKEEDLITNLTLLAHFWSNLNLGNDITDEVNYTISLQSRKYIHCLSCYPNEYWKYVTSVFFFVNKDNEDFEIKFEDFLKKLTASLLAKFIVSPTVNSIKDDIYQAGINIHSDLNFEFKTNFTEEAVIQNLKEHHSSRISRALILLHAYLNNNQAELLNSKFEIEHIFPKKWQNTNYNGWNIEDAEKYLDRFGNKVAFEKRLNIQAGNGYFNNKKAKYLKSEISNVVDLGNLTQSDWQKADIERREATFKDDILNFLKEEVVFESNESELTQ